MTFAFPATDDGGGVYQAILEVDGAPVLARTIDDWGGRCVDTTAGQRVFRYPRPCLTSVDAARGGGRRCAAAGDHDVALRVSDAAGNVRTVYAARKTIAAPGRTIGPGSSLAERGAANGDNAAERRGWPRGGRGRSDDAHRALRRRQRDPRAAHRRRRCRGAQRPHRAGQRHRRSRRAPLDKGGARTRGDGRFTLILPRDASSRTLLLRYRSHANDTVAAAETRPRLKVRAGISSRPSGRAWPERGRQRSRLSGRLDRPAASAGRQGRRDCRRAARPELDHVPHGPHRSRSGRFASSLHLPRGGLRATRCAPG